MSLQFDAGQSLAAGITAGRMTARPSYPESPMFRLSALIQIVAPAILAALSPVATAGELYFPTTVGAKRVMAPQAGDAKSEITETVTKVETEGGAHYVTVEQTVDGRTATAVYQVSEKGVFRTVLKGGKADGWFPLLNLAVKAGETWCDDVPATAASKTGYRITYTLGKEEVVEAHGVKYKAVRVTAEFEVNGEKRQTTRWHAAGVGQVKVVVTGNGAERVTLLKAFTPGDGKAKGEPKTDK
jgi:hypothetical protein